MFMFVYVYVYVQVQTKTSKKAQNHKKFLNVFLFQKKCIFAAEKSDGVWRSW